jgi:hypothetical protein
MFQPFSWSPLVSLVERLPPEQLVARLQQLVPPLEQLILHQLPQLLWPEDVLSLVSSLLDRGVGGEPPLADLTRRLLPLLIGKFVHPTADDHDDNASLAAVGLVGDIYRVDGDIPLDVDHEAVVAAVLGRLLAPKTLVSLKLQCFGTLADMALCLRADFGPYAEAVLGLLASEASQMEAVDSCSAQTEEGYQVDQAELSKCLADAFSALIQALQAGGYIVQIRPPLSSPPDMYNEKKYFIQAKKG